MNMEGIGRNHQLKFTGENVYFGLQPRFFKNSSQQYRISTLCNIHCRSRHGATKKPL